MSIDPLILIQSAIANEIPYRTDVYNIYCSRRIYLWNDNKKKKYGFIAHWGESALLHMYHTHDPDYRIIKSLSDPNLIQDIISTIKRHHAEFRTLGYHRRGNQSRNPLQD